MTVGAGTTVDARVYNLFGLGAIRVSKAVTGDTDELPESLTGDYTVSLDCTRLINGTQFDYHPGGAQRTLDGDGGTATYLGLPTGATCRVTETGSDPQSQETTVEPGTVTLNANENDPVQVKVTNTFHLGSVLVTKQVDGPGADLYGQGPFEVSMAWTADVAGLTRDVPVPGGAERTLDTANSLSTRYDQLPVGARCTLTETRTGGANTSTVAVTTQGGSTVETKGTRADLVVVDDTASSDDGSPAGVTAEVTNRFALGQARVTKRLTGIGADYVDGPFTMRIECTREVDGKQVPVPIPGRLRPHPLARHRTERRVDGPAHRSHVLGDRASRRRRRSDDDQPGTVPRAGRGRQRGAGREHVRRQRAPAVLGAGRRLPCRRGSVR